MRLEDIESIAAPTLAERLMKLGTKIHPDSGTPLEERTFLIGLLWGTALGLEERVRELETQLRRDPAWPELVALREALIFAGKEIHEAWCPESTRGDRPHCDECERITAALAAKAGGA